MKAITFVLTLACLVLAVGCVADNRLPPSERQRAIKSLTELSGSYKNVGVCPALRSNAYPLTDILFPRIKFTHTPDRIRVTLPGPNTVRCEALSQGKVQAVREFIEGRDFHIEDGRIPISAGPAVGTESEAASIEFGYRSKTIFLNPRGDIVVTVHSTGAGVFLLFIPIAGSGYDDSVYERLLDE